ncbi:hypothetical protein [Micromonospora sp. DH14]|uniref:hypothetical protein n=1 Tax=Micromonospora sp. DH14 TaxID=3040120 RepID=UPI0024416AF2|nr:hypothetical protein [Micromonospora sp. DH14]MDG9673373.1 hypothetical protein [Micromonospora sp. DH14]
MVGTAIRWLVGGVLAAAVGLTTTALPALTPDPASAGVVATVRAEPPDGGEVTFEVIPAQPSPEPTQPTPAPTQPAPTRTGGELPVTGSGSSTTGPLALLGLALLFVGWAMARRRRTA